MDWGTNLYKYARVGLRDNAPPACIWRVRRGLRTLRLVDADLVVDFFLALSLFILSRLGYICASLPADQWSGALTYIVTFVSLFRWS